MSNLIVRDSSGVNFNLLDHDRMRFINDRYISVPKVGPMSVSYTIPGVPAGARVWVRPSGLGNNFIHYNLPSTYYSIAANVVTVTKNHADQAGSITLALGYY